MDRSQRSFLLMLVGIFAVMAVASVVVMLVAASASQPSPQPSSSAHLSASEVQERFISELNASAIREDLRYLSSHAHIAGEYTPRNYETAVWVKERFSSMGFKTWMEEFEVLLSYPVSSSLSIVEGRADGYQGLQRAETPIEGDATSSEFVPIFNGYSASGSAVGKLAYVNYCRKEDFDEVAIPAGSVCICRYGKIYRGDKARAAEKNGCTGLLLLSDPADTLSAEQRQEREDAPPSSTFPSPMEVERYPLSGALPLGGIQRGSLLIPNGDPLTPEWGATANEQRLDIDDEYVKDALPSIPVRPISALNALPLMAAMDGPVAPSHWQGGLNITYRLVSTQLKVNFTVEMDNRITKIWNVMAEMEGYLQPDRYVILGNHRDAWDFGAADPSSGTATMLEVARSISKLYQSGWRPARTLLFGSWDAEEYGLTGSTEYCELHREVLKERAVVYLNVDVAADGSEGADVSSTPSLNDVIRRVSEGVPSAVEGVSFLDLWRTTMNASEPKVKNLGSGSDFSGFFQHLGIPSADLAYSKYGSYPTYHSIYESFDWMTQYGDPGFRRHRSIGALWGAVALSFADAHVVPLNYTSTAMELKSEAEKVREMMASPNSAYTSVSTSPLVSAVDEFVRAVQCFDEEKERRMNEVRSTSGAVAGVRQAYAEREYSDRLERAERAFCDDKGVPGREWYKHLIYAPSALNHYAGGAFPSIVDTFLSNGTESVLQTEVYRIARVIRRASDVMCTSLRQD